MTRRWMSSSSAQIREARDRTAIRNVKILQSYVERGLTGKNRRIILRFLVSPTGILGDGHVQALRIVNNELYLDDRGSMRPARHRCATKPCPSIWSSARWDTAACHCPMCPFHDAWGTIPNDRGRVMTRQDDGEFLVGNYARRLDQTGTDRHHRHQQTRRHRKLRSFSGRSCARATPWSHTIPGDETIWISWCGNARPPFSVFRIGSGWTSSSCSAAPSADAAA